MTKKRTLFAGTVCAFLLSTLFLYQNCGVVNVSPMAADVAQKTCDDSHEYVLFTPVEPAVLQLQRYCDDDDQPFEGKDLRRWGAQGSDETLLRLFQQYYQYNCNYNMINQGGNVAN